MNQSSPPYSLDEIMKNILRDVSPFRKIYIYIYIYIIIILIYLSSYYFNITYSGILPFSISMVKASSEIKLLNDITIIYSFFSFFISIFIYFIRGLSPSLIRKLKKHEQWFQMNGANEVQINRNSMLLVGGVLFTSYPFLWIYHFGFSNGGDARLMKATLTLPEPIIALIILSGSVSAFLLLIFSIMSWECRKNVL